MPSMLRSSEKDNLRKVCNMLACKHECVCVCVCVCVCIQHYCMPGTHLPSGKIKEKYALSCNVCQLPTSDHILSMISNDKHRMCPGEVTEHNTDSWEEAPEQISYWR